MSGKRYQWLIDAAIEVDAMGQDQRNVVGGSRWCSAVFIVKLGTKSIHNPLSLSLPLIPVFQTIAPHEAVSHHMHIRDLGSGFGKDY